MTYEDLKREFKLLDTGDPWGNCMAWLFAIAEESHFNRDGSLAQNMEFHPGAATEPDPDRYELQIVAEADDATLDHFAALLQRYRSKCVTAGLSY